jgi:hypothetical protein
VGKDEYAGEGVPGTWAVAPGPDPPEIAPKSDDLDLLPSRFPPFGGSLLNLLVDNRYCSGLLSFGNQNVTGY